jgi:hypothetical protein
MINAMARAGDRLLARLLPQATAGAFCNPQTYCVWCGSYWYSRVWVYADCSSYQNGCTPNCQ